MSKAVQGGDQSTAMTKSALDKKKATPMSSGPSKAEDASKKQTPMSIRAPTAKDGNLQPKSAKAPPVKDQPSTGSSQITKSSTTPTASSVPTIAFPEVEKDMWGSYRKPPPKNRSYYEKMPPIRKIGEVSEKDEPEPEKKGWCTGWRKIALVALLVVLVLIIVGVVLIALWLTGVFGKDTPEAETSTTPIATTGFTSSTGVPVYGGKAATFFDGVCTENHPNVDRSCLAGSPPGLGACNGTCTRFAYRVNPGRNMEFLDTSRTEPQPATTNEIRQLCKFDQNRLGVCSENGCDQLYKGEEVREEKSWYETARWEDSCDEKNPCWDGPTRVLERQPVSREECRNQTTDCEKDQDAIVWMQQLRCKIGKNRTFSGGCTGLPMQLWLCKSCDRKRQLDCRGGTLSFNLRQCTYTCQYPAANVVNPLPNGRKCNYTADPEALAYCFEGQCFPVHDNVSDTKPMSIGKCNETWAGYD